MKLLISLVLAVTAYVVVGVALALATQAVWPDALPVAGRRPEALSLLLVDLAGQCIACMAAGGCAMAPAGLRLRPVFVGVGMPLLAITLVCTLEAWSDMPDAYDIALLLLTAPFFALGAAWRHAARKATISTSYHAT